MKKNLIKEAAQAKKQIADKESIMMSEIEVLKKQYSEVSNFYYTAIRKLENEKCEKLETINQNIQELRDNQQDFFDKTHEPISQLKKILILIDLSKKEKEKDLTLNPNSRYGMVEEVATLMDNKYLNLRVFIYNNNKPKNKYTLFIAGQSFFWGEKLIKYQYNYGMGLNWSFNDPSILIELKSAPSVEELRDWWEKNKKRSFWSEQQHNEVVSLYEWTLENCNTYEWQLEYLLERKDHYENKHYRGTELPEYKKVLSAIKKLKMKEPA